jgi:HK97 family phage major capsid protein/HK97 family phage prohead protease
MTDEPRRVRSILDGIVEEADGRRVYTKTDGLYSRVVPLDDIEVLTRAKGGDGRTVRAYAAVFDSPTEIVDQDGHYNEQIARTAFDQSLAMRSRAVGVFYNHARTIQGTPSERASVPLGKPLMIKPDGRGLLTESQYNRTQLAEEVLEAIRNGDITGQSFTGIFLRSDPVPPYYPSRDGGLPLVTRQEIALIEYGPTPIPAYQDAAILGVRAAMDSDSDRGNITTPDAADLNAAARRYAASQGWAMPDGSYPIRPADMHGRADLEAAIHAVGRGGGSHDAIRRHIITRAKAIGMADMIPDGWSSGGTLTSTSTSSTSGRDAGPAGAPAADGTGAAVRAGGAPAGAAPEPRKHSATTHTNRSTKRGRPMDDRMTVEERAARQSEIRARLAEIDNEYSGAALPQDVQAEWDELNDENDEHERAVQATLARRERLAQLAQNPAATESVAQQRAGHEQRHAPALVRKPDNIYDLGAIRNRARSLDEMASLCRDYAMRAVEQAEYPGVPSREDAQSRAERLLNTVDNEEGALARRMLVTGSPVYQRAFGKAITALSTNGLTGEEQRALSLGADSAGGFAVPFQLDPTVILTSDGVINPLRRLARVVQITGKEWQGVTSAGITVTRASEADEAQDNSPTLAQPTVRAERVQAFVPFSVEIEADWNALRGEVTMMLQDAKDTEEAASFTNGDGTAPNPQGILTGANVTVTSGTAGTLTLDDLDALEGALPPRFRARATYMANRAFYVAVRNLARSQPSAAGDPWVAVSTSPTGRELNGFPSAENSEMVATQAAGDKVAVLGDFRQFLIVDRIGMSVELVPHLFGAARRMPTGQRGLYAYWRNNCKVLVPGAFRVLVIKSGA